MRQPHFIILSIIHLLSENKIRKQQKADTRLRVSAKNLCSVGEKGSTRDEMEKFYSDVLAVTDATNAKVQAELTKVLALGEPEAV